MVKKKENHIVVEKLYRLNVETMVVAHGVEMEDYINIIKIS
jgi:hypothetical protein